MNINVLLLSILCLMFTNCTPELNPSSKHGRIVENENLLENLLKTQPQYFDKIISNKDKYQVQILYTQINRDSTNAPSFKSYRYNVDPQRYFYPASTVKLPAAFLALEKLNEMNIKGLDRHTTMLTDSAFSGQTAVRKDSTAASGRPSIAHYLKKIFLVSDNDAYNRIYEFLGQEEINRKLKEKGYDTADIITRLAIFLSEAENRHTNPLKFVDASDSVIFQQPMLYNKGALPEKGQVLKGKGHMRNGEFIPKPMDFSLKNFLPLDEMQMMLRAVLFPEHTEEQHLFNLTAEDYRFIYQYLSQLPSETSWPKYDAALYPDAHSKLLMYGNEKEAIPKHIRIFNKYGQSYGYLIDNAYIIDLKNGVEFMLSAVIQTNENEIYNDNKYEYEEIGFPFMKNLGQLIYQYELDREREYSPDLTKFMVGYDKVVKMTDQLHPNLYQNYGHYHIPALNFRRIKRSDIEPYIEKLKDKPGFEVTQAATSVEGRPINLVKVGNGPTKVLLWSQMHGDESTATRALFEVFNFLSSDDSLNEFRKKILQETTLHFIPMLNPDGAENYQRRNALSIDINRDALRLTSPEAKILKSIRDKYDHDFGFNLHDQSRHYNVYRTGKTAALSFLAPAYNYEKAVNEGRSQAMKLIVSMDDVLQHYIPGQIGRYDDAFETRAFGDNMQKWGTNTILIESGGKINDPEKRELVKMNFIAILHALHQLAGGNFVEESVYDYFNIPDNDRKFFDLLIRNGKVSRNNDTWLMDVGIFQYEKTDTAGFYRQGSIAELGDLSTYYGYAEFDATGMVISAGRILPEVQHVEEITKEAAYKWLKNGYTAVKVPEMPSEREQAALPIQVVPVHQQSLPNPDLRQEANLLLSEKGTVKYAIINGRMIDLTSTADSSLWSDQ